MKFITIEALERAPHFAEPETSVEKSALKPEVRAELQALATTHSEAKRDEDRCNDLLKTYVGLKAKLGDRQYWQSSQSKVGQEATNLQRAKVLLSCTSYRIALEFYVEAIATRRRQLREKLRSFKPWAPYSNVPQTDVLSLLSFNNWVVAKALADRLALVESKVHAAFESDRWNDAGRAELNRAYRQLRQEYNLEAGAAPDHPYPFSKYTTFTSSLVLPDLADLAVLRVTNFDVLTERMKEHYVSRQAVGALAHFLDATKDVLRHCEGVFRRMPPVKCRSFDDSTERGTFETQQEEARRRALDGSELGSFFLELRLLYDNLTSLYWSVRHTCHGAVIKQLAMADFADLDDAICMSGCIAAEAAMQNIVAVRTTVSQRMTAIHDQARDGLTHVVNEGINGSSIKDTTLDVPLPEHVEAMLLDLDHRLGSM